MTASFRAATARCPRSVLIFMISSWCSGETASALESHLQLGRRLGPLIQLVFYALARGLFYIRSVLTPGHLDGQADRQTILAHRAHGETNSFSGFPTEELVERLVPL